MLSHSIFDHTMGRNGL